MTTSRGHITKGFALPLGPPGLEPWIRSRRRAVNRRGSGRSEGMLGPGCVPPGASKTNPFDRWDRRSCTRRAPHAGFSLTGHSPGHVWPEHTLRASHRGPRQGDSGRSSRFRPSALGLRLRRTRTQFTRICVQLHSDFRPLRCRPQRDWTQYPPTSAGGWGASLRAPLGGQGPAPLAT